MKYTVRNRSPDGGGFGSGRRALSTGVTDTVNRLSGSVSVEERESLLRQRERDVEHEHREERADDGDLFEVDQQRVLPLRERRPGERGGDLDGDREQERGGTTEQCAFGERRVVEGPVSA